MHAAMSLTDFASLVALALGYIVCFAMWWFIFRKGGDD